MHFDGDVCHPGVLRQALPVVLGGVGIADEVVDIFIPVRFYWVRRGRWLKLHGIAEKDADHVILPPLPVPHSNGQPVAAAVAGDAVAC